MINYQSLDCSLLLPLATHYSIVFLENMYSLYVESSYYRSKVSIKSETDSVFQVNPILKFLIQFPVHFTPCSSTFVPLCLSALLPQTRGLVWKLELHGSRRNCCLLHSYHPRTRLLKCDDRYSSCSVSHRSVVGIHALLYCAVHVPSSGFFASLVTIVAG